MQGFLDLDLEFQTLNDEDEIGITATRKAMIQQLQLKEKDLPRPFCGRKMYIGMLKLKNDGTGQMNSLKQTKFQSWGSFNLLIPYQHELFYPEELTKQIDAIKKTATKDDTKADDIQMEIAQYFDAMSQEKIKNGESPYPTVDCRLFMNDALKEKVVESVKVFNQPNYSYIHQEDCVICYVGTAVKKKPYTDAGGILQPGIQLGVDDIWFFRPPSQS
jgi:hypothetical protein